MQSKLTYGHQIILNWLSQHDRTPFQFQIDTWEHISNGKSGLVNAPTGCGKTYSVFLGAVIQFMNQYPKKYTVQKNNGLQLLWVTPLRALAKDIGRAMEEVITQLNLQWKVGIRNGDTTTTERTKQKKQVPEILIITPESLHLLLAQKEYPQFFKTMQLIAIDEWHELLGGKRGVQMELAISRLLHLQKELNIKMASVWGLSATIGNLEEAKEVLLYPIQKIKEETTFIVKASLDKKITIESIFPDVIEEYPWAGHLGVKLVNKVLPIIKASRSTLIFINTRGMSEIWYQSLLTANPDLAGVIALHHGSIEQALRFWVEEELHKGTLKAVVCTASLDLGVDFRPVETVIQVGSPKGIARFLQRAGRSGHQPDAESKIYFLPTHSLELLEAAALKTAIEEKEMESKTPLQLCYDVLIQYLCTIAIGEGFNSEKLFEEVKTTFCFKEIELSEWQEIINIIVHGGKSLGEYDDYKKVELVGELYRMQSRRMAMRHRMHIGTIVSDAMMKVKLVSGGFIGVIEEYFISRLDMGTCFALSGRVLELVSIKDMTAYVKKSTSKKFIVPSWMGGRMSFTSNMGDKLRIELNSYYTKEKKIELIKLEPLLALQQQLSKIPKHNELLIEHIETKDGYHLFVYPFEGRLVHEAMAAILAYRISKLTPITFSFVMNDYGFELLSDQPIPLDDSNVYELFTSENLFTDIQRSVNSSEMAMRKFRDIAVIGGLIFQGMPGEKKKQRHIQSSASLLFKVFQEYDAKNLLLKQAYQEVFDQQMEEERLRAMLKRIQESTIVITYPQQLTPFCFPIKVDSMREDVSSEKLEERVKRMIKGL
jgi:ATP-dependent helicase Lhr and Lhr-like helicase